MIIIQSCYDVVHVFGPSQDHRGYVKTVRNCIGRYKVDQAGSEESSETFGQVDI